MKRCPECEFLYEDEQEHCEMDGTRLFFTTTLPPLPAGLTPPKSIWGGFTIPLLAALVLGTVVTILYRATPRAYSSPATVQTQTASQSIPDPNQTPDTPPSDTSQPGVSAGSSDDSARDPFSSVQPKEKEDKPAPAANEKMPAPGPVIHIQAASSSQPANSVTVESKPATNQPILTNQTTPANQKSSASSSSGSSHPKPPASTATPAAPQNANKDSKVNSFFKKAGKVLKKPFGEN